MKMGPRYLFCSAVSSTGIEKTANDGLTSMNNQNKRGEAVGVYANSCTIHEMTITLQKSFRR